MAEIASTLANTPLPTILVVSGMFFVFIAIGGQFGAHIITEKIRPIVALGSGAFLMIAGIALYTTGEKGPLKDSGTAQGKGSSESMRVAVEEHGKSSSESKPAAVEIPRPRIIFTTGLSTEKDPINDIKKISLNTERIYVFCTWFGLTGGKQYAYKSEIRDGQNIVVYTDDSTFTPENTSWNTWSWYRIKTKVDHAGVWTFRVSLGDQKADGQLIVLEK